MQQRAGDRQPLPLSAGEALAAFADARLVSLREHRDELVRMRRARRGLDLGQRRVGTAVRDVVRDRVVEEHGVLRDQADVAAQRPQRHVADVEVVDEDGPVGHVVEARQQVDERRLARAAEADDGDDLAGIDPERDAVEHRPPFAVGVGEADVPELDAAHGTRQRNGPGPIGDLGVRVEQLEDALSGRHRLLQGRIHAAEAA